MKYNGMKKQHENKPYLSICLPTSNRLEYLRNTIEFLLNDFADISIEIVVVDGCSHDGTADYIASLMDKHNVHLIEEDKLEGAVNAIQKALDYANGKFIMLRHDHSFTIKIPVLDACKLLDTDSSIGVVIEKIYNTRKRYRKTGLYARYLGIDESFICRNADNHKIDSNFMSYVWGHDSVISYLRKGKTVAYLKDISFIDVVIEHTDTLHDLNKNVTNKKSAVVLDSKLGNLRSEELEKFITQRASTLMLIKANVFIYFFKLFTRVINSRYSYRAGYLFSFLGYKQNNIIPYFDSNKFGPAFHVKLDIRPNIPYLDYFLDMLHKNCCLFEIKYAGNLKDNFYLFQKLSDDIILESNNNKV
jgi:glycosyltransferase involved in cell wall biosynthesis